MGDGTTHQYNDLPLVVAGGKGKLSIQLALQGKIQSTVIDPLVRKHGDKLDSIGAKRIRKAKAPHPAFLSKEFKSSSLLFKILLCFEIRCIVSHQM